MEAQQNAGAKADGSQVGQTAAAGIAGPGTPMAPPPSAGSSAIGGVAGEGADDEPRAGEGPQMEMGSEGDRCPEDADKPAPGICGCGEADSDSDGDGVADCEDGCPMDADKMAPGVCGCGQADAAEQGCGAEAEGSCGPVRSPVPPEVREALDLDPFYQKYVDAGGLAILASSEPEDASLLAACELVNDMLVARDDVREALIRSRARFAIIGRDEGTAEIPEYGYGNRPQQDVDYINQRARGLGGQVASCGEENILCLRGDRYRRESICVHEFSHTISTYGLYRVDRTFERRLREAFEHAQQTGLYANTYALENPQEYWAEGVQNWYDTNDEAIPANGIHNEINTRAEFVAYDPTLAALVEELLPEATAFDDCHRR